MVNVVQQNARDLSLPEGFVDSIFMPLSKFLPLALLFWEKLERDLDAVSFFFFFLLFSSSYLT